MTDNQPLTDLQSLPKVCAYCGTTETPSVDHVIPKSFDAEDDEEHPHILVWACKVCNNQVKARLDEKIRDLLAVDLYGGQHPTAQKLVAGAISRAITKRVKIGHKHLLLELASNAELTEIKNQSGGTEAVGMGGTLKDDYFTQWLTLVVQGLTMALFETRLDNPEVEVLRIYPHAIPQARADLAPLKLPPPVPIGTHTEFSYSNAESGIPGVGVWVFQFFGQVVFVVYVTPQGFAWGEEENTEATSG